MNRRRFSLAALVTLIWGCTRGAGDTRAETTCQAVPPFIRQDDPIKALFAADLHNWARTNQHIAHARVVVHPMFAYLLPVQGMTSEFNTDFTVVVNPQMPVPWAIVPECG